MLTVQKYKNVYGAKTYSWTIPIQPLLTQAQSVITFISYVFFPSAIVGPRKPSHLSRLKLLSACPTHGLDTRPNVRMLGEVQGDRTGTIHIPGLHLLSSLSEVLFPRFLSRQFHLSRVSSALAPK